MSRIQDVSFTSKFVSLVNRLRYMSGGIFFLSICMAIPNTSLFNMALVFSTGSIFLGYNSLYPYLKKRLSRVHDLRMFRVLNDEQYVGFMLVSPEGNIVKSAVNRLDIKGMDLSINFENRSKVYIFSIPDPDNTEKRIETYWMEMLNEDKLHKLTPEDKELIKSILQSNIYDSEV